MIEQDLVRTLRVQQWLIHEARLLDARRFDLWLALLHPDIRYKIPDRSYLIQKDVADFTSWAVEKELESPGGVALVNEDLLALQLRIARFQTKMGWSEMPPSMARRLVGNVVVEGETDGALSVASTLFLSKVRREERVLFTAERRDRLIETAEGYQLRARYVVLDEVILPSENLSLLF